MSILGVGGSALLDFSGDPKFRTLHNTKSPGVESRIGGLMTDYDTTKGAGQSALSDYISRYLAQTPETSARTAEEIAPLNRIYSGGAASDLATLRAQRTQAIDEAARVAGQSALARANRSVVGDDGSGGSYRDRLLMSATMPYHVNAAADEAAQARADYEYLQNQQLALGGRRQSMEDQLLARGLVPQQLRQAMYSGDVNNLAGISGLENANNIYGVQQKTTGAQRWGHFLQDAQGYQDKDMATMAQSY